MVLPELCVAVQAAEKIAERAASSPRWRRAFVKLGGVEVLLKMLRGGLDADSVRAIMRALAELLKENSAQEVRWGGPRARVVPVQRESLSCLRFGGGCTLLDVTGGSL